MNVKFVAVGKINHPQLLYA